MSHPAILKIETFLAKKPTPDQFGSALSALMGIFLTDEHRPPLGEYLSLLGKLKTCTPVYFFSSLLDSYSPSLQNTSPASFDFEWAFLSKVPPEKREEDKAFFSKLWAACESKKMPLTAPLREVILASMFKHSGLTNDWQFGRALQAIEKKAGYIPFELLAAYENEAKELRPMTLIFNWVRLCLFAYGLSATVSLLRALCRKQETEDYFDVAQLWDNHVSTFGAWRHMTYSEVLVETQKLAMGIGVSLPDLDTIPNRMLFPLTTVPESENDDTETDDGDPHYGLPTFK